MEKSNLTKSQLEASLARFEKFLNNIKNDFDSTETTNDKVEALKSRLERILPLINLYENLYYQIPESSEDFEAEISFTNFENLYHTQVGIARNLINRKSQNLVRTSDRYSSRSGTTSPISGRNSPANSINSNAQTIPNVEYHRNHNYNISLPKITLSKFNGDAKSWLEFKNIFINLIHDNLQLNEVQKFHYLKASLTGTATDVISSLNFNSESYAIAWNTLIARFDQPKVIIKNHLNSIIELEVQNKESASDLRRINDVLFKHVSALKSLASTEQLFETLIVYLVSNKLHAATVREWEINLSKSIAILPTLSDFKEFLTNHSNLLENIENRQLKKVVDKPKFHSKSFVTTSPFCALCEGEHPISGCERFADLTPEQRTEKVKELKICFNCLSKNHFLPQCTSKYSCRICKHKHHTLLHQSKRVEKTPNSTVALPTLNPSVDEEPLEIVSAFCSTTTQVLLPTATGKVQDSTGNYQSLRILLDSGSQSNFLRADTCNRLGLGTSSANVFVTGLNNSNTNIKTKCELELHSQHSNFKIKLSCLILDQITGSVPSVSIKLNNFQIPKNIQLSDPNFDKPGKIDILIGSSTFFELLCIGQIKLGTALPILQKTYLGWIISGPTGPHPNNQVQCHHSIENELNDQLVKFWEIDNYPTDKVFSPEESACEAHFVEHTRRDNNGRFIVSIPFKEPPSLLGDSFSIAQKRFFALERRLQANPMLYKEYSAFIREYLDLGHMSLDNRRITPSYYLPHHGVHKLDSLTTKLRVVFNGSSVTSTGQSLNSLQMIGPTIQSDLFSVLIRFRQHTYAISADIEKMYRQVYVDEEQRVLQRILWRFAPNDPIEIYNLNTVTYGTASASYLAIRSLIQLGNDIEKTLPKISEIIKRDFYVDDLLSGSDSIESARKICTQLSDTLKTGCFKLRKWISNHSEVLSDIPTADVHPGLLHIGDSESSRTLGLTWFFQTDHFMFKISGLSNLKTTKRQMLSEIAQIFDPLGLLGPCTFVAKIFMQKLWLEKLNWDDIVPKEIEAKWLSYRSELLLLNELKIPRHVTCSSPKDVQIHGFCDASINGYGACIYIRSVSNNDKIYINLLCSKSKVAPLRPTTIPKLELCGALLLSKLLVQVKKTLILKCSSCFLWTDSTIVLGWLKTSPNLLKTFVCNRVADIQNITLDAVWCHVPTKHNPADLLSRGTTPQVLMDSVLWWNGPSWLFETESSWPHLKSCPSDLPELKKETQFFATTVQPFCNFEDYSSLTKLERVTAYCLRFIKNCSKQDKDRQFGPLTAKELTLSLNTLIKISQSDSFYHEYKLLKKGLPLKSKSSLVSFNPFIDTDDLIRVGGRLHNSLYTHDKKHPFLLSGKHYLSKLITSREHLVMLHAGPQLLLASLRDRFWITNGRNLVKQVVHRCVTCFRVSPILTQPIMGNLPTARVQPTFPFLHTGIDYAGPILIKDRKGRGAKITKAYLCLFICFATKAVHLELVTGLSTELFILALKRFISRRGKPLQIYSDNGTNFVGARHQLLDLGTFLETNHSSISELSADLGISWSFIPARSPHFGGLWESGIKSCKSHLKRVIGQHVLTYEEFCTLLYQVEAILNSRPLAPLSSDPNDLQPLTPGHFLVGRPLSALPEPDVTLLPENRLDNFQIIQKFIQHLWTRWSKEYISELQQRVKWKIHHSDLTNDALVLIKEDNLPPLKWKLGRVIKLHPGADGINRVATVRTSTGIIKRAFSKLCPLPSS